MLPSAHRLRTATDYRAVLRGRTDSARLSAARAGGHLLVVHAARHPDSFNDKAGTGEHPLPRVGFVVSKAVGGSVVRNRTKRVLRHLVRERLGAVPTDVDLVVRAQPASAGATTADLGGELDRLLRSVLKRLS
ncbi:hypothetical protein VV02_02425 [Luteipulveratus mongoliensis]|uniref:Ribonuclease P protein component n=1 Tax=Luteipulveratus mongoliensis TaxID=571913 RepID=A0A0K1JPR4_9MICO|nr:hypothetical protein VV02_02425 [Luteipulveratus mongoliensis]